MTRKPHELTPLDSSALAGYHHDPQTRDLIVQYKRPDGSAGDTWRYQDVGVDKVHTMVNAQSPGTYLNSRIKGVHVGRKIS